MTENLKPPPGYNSWLDYAIATMDTRSLHLYSLDEDSVEYAHWGGSLKRQEMTDAAKRELRSFVSASVLEAVKAGLKAEIERLKAALDAIAKEGCEEMQSSQNAFGVVTVEECPDRSNDVADWCNGCIARKALEVKP